MVGPDGVVVVVADGDEVVVVDVDVVVVVPGFDVPEGTQVSCSGA